MTLPQLLPGQRIAVVGLSAQTDRPSYEVSAVMQRAGFHIIPVNPRYADETILGERCVGSLADISAPVDIVNCFRRSEEMLQIAIDVVAMPPAPKTLWMQQGIANAAAREIAERAGIHVVENHCIKVAFLSQR